MAKNSVFILLVSVCVLIGIGMVMLFSTGAYANDAHGDALLFPPAARQPGWASGLWPARSRLSPTTIACLKSGGCCSPSPRCCWRCVSSRTSDFGSTAHRAGSISGRSCSNLVRSPNSRPLWRLAWWFTKHEQQSSQFVRGFVAPMLIVGVLMLLIVREEDLGTTMLICATMVAVMFVAGSNFFYHAAARGDWRGRHLTACPAHDRAERAPDRHPRS